VGGRLGRPTFSEHAGFGLQRTNAKIKPFILQEGGSRTLTQALRAFCVGPKETVRVADSCY
jgi:hypothetical protein